MNDDRLYILMRNDLPSMSTGRAAAQASHATNALVHEWGGRIEVKNWQKQTKQGFGTAIVLTATGSEIAKIFRTGELRRYLMKGWVIDPDYVVSISIEFAPFIKGVFTEISETDPNRLLVHRSEKTCAYLFGSKEYLQPYLGKLPLYP